MACKRGRRYQESPGAAFTPFTFLPRLLSLDGDFLVGVFDRYSGVQHSFIMVFVVCKSITWNNK